MNKTSRRKLIATGAAAVAGVGGVAAAALIAGKYGLIPPDNGGVYGPGETLTYAVQRLLTTGAMAREFPRSMISQEPFANTIAPPNDEFRKMEDRGFADWRLAVDGAVDGMVARPASLSLADLKGFPVHRQITEVACEEGWSYIAEWIGTPLSEVLKACGLSSQARYVSYFSIDKNWWDAIDMADALHPQTLVTWGMNGGELPVPFGGPIRMRVPRQLGYKSIKQITRITVSDSLKWPGTGYSWYAGI